MAGPVFLRGMKVRFHSLIFLEGTKTSQIRRCRLEVRGDTWDSACLSAEVSCLLGSSGHLTVVREVLIFLSSLGLKRE